MKYSAPLYSTPASVRILGSDEIRDSLGRLYPVDATVLDRTFVEKGGLHTILFGPLRPPGFDQREGFDDHRAEQRECLVKQVGYRFRVLDRHALLQDDVARVETLVHEVDSHTDLGLPVDQRPVQRREPAVAGQQRVMKVDRPVPGQYGEFGRDLRPPVRGHQDIRSQVADPAQYLIVIGVRPFEHRNSVMQCQLRDRVVPDDLVFVRTLGMSDDERNLMIGP